MVQIHNKQLLKLLPSPSRFRLPAKHCSIKKTSERYLKRVREENRKLKEIKIYGWGEGTKNALNGWENVLETIKFKGKVETVLRKQNERINGFEGDERERGGEKEARKVVKLLLK